MIAYVRHLRSRFFNPSLASEARDVLTPFLTRGIAFGFAMSGQPGRVRPLFFFLSGVEPHVYLIAFFSSLSNSLRSVAVRWSSLSFLARSSASCFSLGTYFLWACRAVRFV